MFRRLLVSLGIAIAVAGIAMVVDPEIAAIVSADQVAVVVVGVLILIQGVRVVRARRKTTITEAETSDPESAMVLPTPGDDFDEGLAPYRRASARQPNNRGRLYKRLEQAAITAISWRRDCSRDEAIQQLRDGSWTEDRSAAAFFGGEHEMASMSFGDWLRSLVSPETRFYRQARHAADAVLRLAEGDEE
jgi:hypothetical protein